VAGMLFDYTQHYDYSFYMSGVLLMGAALVMVVPWQYTNGSCRLPDDPGQVTDSARQAKEAEAAGSRAPTDEAEEVGEEHDALTVA